ncbi:MAG: 2-dehydropantoate 2-reductase, partial [Candidatus Diapherotrites archaeon]|nr:2-dehydropantoate 2-reductase [Candidatus Diapherotrites archaeon]
NGELVRDDVLRERLVRIVEEGEDVCDAMGVRVRAVEKALSTAGSLAANKCSMLQDIEQGRRTEVEFLNGALCREGRRLGVPTPENDCVLKQVLALR